MILGPSPHFHNTGDSRPQSLINFCVKKNRFGSLKQTGYAKKEKDTCYFNTRSQ